MKTPDIFYVEDDIDYAFFMQSAVQEVKNTLNLAIVEDGVEALKKLQHFAEHKSIAHYASLLGISSKHLNRIVQTVVQKTATDVITERVVLEAKRMLMYLDESLVEIAFRLGYEEYSYFVRVFRKSSGMTPTQFMRKYKA